jgi:hypothetical protein
MPHTSGTVIGLVMFYGDVSVVAWLVWFGFGWSVQSVGWLGWSVRMKRVYLLYLSVMHVENSAAVSIISIYLTFPSSVNSNIQTSDGFIKCEGTSW